MEKLEDIGFYTLSDARARNSSHVSRLQRCEVLVTKKCNFKCPYCRQCGPQNDMSWENFKILISYWKGLKNIRISGGEPTLWRHLNDAIALCKESEIKRIAISTNGSADLDIYSKLVGLGVNDFSISLDACCVSEAKKMAGGIDSWDKVVKNIIFLSKLTYVTVGVVLTSDNENNVLDIIKFSESLGVADIRIIPAANYHNMLKYKELLNHQIKTPILKYRISNMRLGKPVRGLDKTCHNKCPLVLDDMAVCENFHFPCIIYLREGGNPIGKVSSTMRIERLEWYLKHDTYSDKICSKNCLDVCRDYNNKYLELKKYKLETIFNGTKKSR